MKLLLQLTGGLKSSVGLLVCLLVGSIVGLDDCSIVGWEVGLLLNIEEGLEDAS